MSEPATAAKESIKEGPGSAGRTARFAAWIRALDRPVALLAGMAFITQVGVAVMLPLLPLYAISLGADPTVLGLLTSAFAVALAGGHLLGGFLTERFPARRMVTTGIGIYGVANVLIATSPAALPLIGFRSLAGFGAGINQVAERIYLAQAIDRTRLAFANGVLSAAGSAGSVMGPAIGGILAAASDLRVPFVLVGLTSLLAFVGSLFLPRGATERPADQTEAPEQAVGTAEQAEGAAEQAQAANRTVTAEPVGTEQLPPAVVDAAATADRSVHFDDAAGASMSANQRLVRLFVVQAAFQASFGAFITTYAPLATSRLGWQLGEVGIVFSMFGLGSIVFGPWLARQADRRGRRDFAVLGALLILAFPIVYAAEAPRVVLYPVTIAAGAGLTALEASFFALLADATDGGRRGRAYGLINALSSLGIAVGATVAAQVWTRSGDVGLGMLVCALSLMVTIGALLAYPRDRGARGEAAAAGLEAA